MLRGLDISQTPMLREGEHVNPIITRLLAGAATTAAAVVAKRAVEFGWERATGDAPPTAQKVDGDRDLRDLIVWAAVLTASVTLARKLARRSVERLADD
jgi:hypothetical protein